MKIKRLQLHCKAITKYEIEVQRIHFTNKQVMNCLICAVYTSGLHAFERHACKPSNACLATIKCAMKPLRLKLISGNKDHKS